MDIHCDLSLPTPTPTSLVTYGAAPRTTKLVTQLVVRSSPIFPLSPLQLALHPVQQALALPVSWRRPPEHTLST
jgi:hypothetical protein